MALVFDLVRLALRARTASAFVRCAVVSACLPRMPPHNWASGNKAAPRVRLNKAETKRKSMLHTLRCVIDPARIMSEYADLQKFLSTESKERIIAEDSLVLIEIPRTVNDTSPQFTFESPHSGDVSLTVVDSSESAAALDDVGFSIYSDISAPNLNKAMFITPVRPKLPSTVDVDLSLLRAASERVSEILRENRRRLDAGEDTSTIRREARRRRTKELSAARNHGSSTF